MSKAWCLTPSENDDALELSSPCHTVRCTPLRDLFDMIRPATILQAVGALVVGGMTNSIRKVYRGIRKYNQAELLEINGDDDPE